MADNKVAQTTPGPWQHAPLSDDVIGPRACRAAIAYDDAIRGRGESGDVKRIDAGGAIAAGADLDALYFDWQEKAEAAIAKAEGR